MYKYIYKGHDAATITIGNNNERVIDHDEIKNYLKGRYVGPVEAVYRILSKPLQDKSHTVYRLQIHIPNYQNLIISNDSLNIDILNQSSSMLLEYFKLNAELEDGRQYFYKEIPIFFVYNKSKKHMTCKWEKRKRKLNYIGRMYSISPSQIELFHLRLLLSHIKGATSFEHLRTVDGVIKSSFTAACLALGLIEDE